MEAKINIAEILKEKPQGTKLYDLLRNIDVVLDKVHITDVGNYIECISTNEVGSTIKFDYSKLGTEGGWLDGYISPHAIRHVTRKLERITKLKLRYYLHNNVEDDCFVIRKIE